MSAGPIEVYHARPVSDLGTWSAGAVDWKIYGLLARRMEITPGMIETARRFLEGEVLDRVASMGESNGLGFLIIHPGDTGLSIAAHWWVQGSILCQHIYRKAYGDTAPMDAVTRPVVGCVWELDLVGAEREAWQARMMTEQPDRTAYLGARAHTPVVQLADSTS
ncbi:MAG: hypothetical protein AAFY66_17315 [Pseudomonadota bacterium]